MQSEEFKGVKPVARRLISSFSIRNALWDMEDLLFVWERVMRRWDEEYRSVWGKLPDQALSPQEFQKHYPKFRKWVCDLHARNHPRHCSVDFVLKHYRKIGSEEREKERNRQDLEERRAYIKQYKAREAWFASQSAHVATPTVGRNQPCPCGSGKKFKKCCGP
jgi:uncharacterized protein YchJ